MAGNIVKVNRAPVLTLWAAVVAERLGYERDTALRLRRVRHPVSSIPPCLRARRRPKCRAQLDMGEGGIALDMPDASCTMLRENSARGSSAP